MAHRTGHRERGTIYLPILAATTLVGIIAIAAIALTRAQGKMSYLSDQWATSQQWANVGVESALYMIDDNDSWRDMALINGGQIDLMIFLGPDDQAMVTVTDPLDGDLTDDPAENALITATGVSGDGRHMMAVDLLAHVRPLEALGMCLHAAGEVEVKGGCYLTVQDAPLSTNGNLKIDEMVIGDAEGLTRSGGGIITGTTTLGGDPKGFPPSTVIDDYIAKAVTIVDPGGTIEDFVLSPASNPWGGAVDSEGVYYINTGGSNLTIKYARIWGTLIVRTGGGKVTIQEAVFMEPFRDDYPVLIIDGDAKVEIKNASRVLSEVDRSVNFNPVGTPYQGTSDDDQLDIYPNGISGLIHVTGRFELDESPVINGAVLCESDVVCHSSTSLIVHDPDLVTNPPEGYEVIEMELDPASWRHVVD